MKFVIIFAALLTVAVVAAGYAPLSIHAAASADPASDGHAAAVNGGVIRAANAPAGLAPAGLAPAASARSANVHVDAGVI